VNATAGLEHLEKSFEPTGSRITRIVALVYQALPEPHSDLAVPVPYMENKTSLKVRNLNKI
jgi:hypothetical protein